MTNIELGYREGHHYLIYAEQDGVPLTDEELAEINETDVPYLIWLENETKD
jgi:hypothetical protein